MKKAELVELLNENFDDEDEVFFCYNYGDYGKTTVAERVKYVGMCNLSWSSYHNRHVLIDIDSSTPIELRNQLVLGHDRDPLETAGEIVW